MDLEINPTSTSTTRCTEDAVNALLCRGEMSLLTGNISGLELFEQAAQLDPSNSQLFYRQGLSLFQYGSESGKEKTLHLASKKFKTATQLNPDYFDAWQAWGNVLFLLGSMYGEHHYTQDALEKYQKAIALSQGQPTDIMADLYWDYGVIWKRMGEHSKEGLDLQLSVEAFQKASSMQEELPSEFWYDYGCACTALSSRINDVRLYVKAVHCYKRSISIDASYYEGWRASAKSLSLLYAHTHDEDHFTEASDSFATAANLCPQNAQIWFEWATLLRDSGRRNLDAKRLRLCIEKCHLAYSCNPLFSVAIAIWAESLALLGALSDRIDYIHEAQNKISEAENLDADSPEIHYSAGMCLISCAEYFSDLDYYYQAIEKFQTGLSIDRSHAPLWHGMALSYAAVGDLTEDVEAYQKANRFFSKALDLAPSSTYYIFDYALALSQLGEISGSQEWLEEAVIQFERVLSMQKNAIYLHPEWLFHYAQTLDMLGDFHEEESYYLKAVEIFSHVLMIDPDFLDIHHRLALTFSHLGDLIDDVDHLYRAVHHYRLALKRDEENDRIMGDWGLTLINIAERCSDMGEAASFYRDAENKLTTAAKLGNVQSYYNLGCLYSLLGQYEKAMAFIAKADQFEALPSLDQLQNDDWLDGLRSTLDFNEFLLQIERRANRVL
jgi:tetratricopeptide (TPR) repeat protein